MTHRAGSLAGNIRFAIYNYPDGSRFYIKRPLDPDWIEAGATDESGRRDGDPRGPIWVTGVIAMPDYPETLGIRFKTPDGILTWPSVDSALINSLATPSGDTRWIYLDAASQAAPNGVYGPSIASTEHPRDLSAVSRGLRGVSLNSMPQGAIVFLGIRSGSVWAKGDNITSRGTRSGTSFDIPGAITSDVAYVIQTSNVADDSVQYAVTASPRNVSTDGWVRVDAAIPTGATSSPPLARPESSAATTNGSVSHTSESTDPGSLLITSNHEMSEVNLYNSNGTKVYTSPIFGMSGLANGIPAATYAVKVTTDAGIQSIDNVAVAAGVVSGIVLTDASLARQPVRPTVTPEGNTPPVVTSPPVVTPPATHRINLLGLQPGDHVVLSPATGSPTTVDASEDHDVSLADIANGSYTLTVTFTNGRSNTRTLVVTPASATTIDIPYASLRGEIVVTDDEPVKKSNAVAYGFAAVAVAAVGGGIYLKYYRKPAK